MMVTWLADEERITLITTIRLLYRPADHANLISQRIVREKNLVPKKIRKSVEFVVWLSFVAIIPLLAFVIFVVPLLWLLSPAIIATMSAMFSLRVLRTGLLDYVSVTTLPDVEVIKGLVGGVLARLEVWQRALTLLIPFVALVFIVSAALLVIADGDLDEGLYALVAMIAMVIGLTGANVLGAALGVGLALWRRDLVAVVIGAPAMLLFVVGGLTGFVLTLETPPFGLLFAALFMVAPYLLATGTMNLSRRWIRETA